MCKNRKVLFFFIFSCTLNVQLLSQDNVFSHSFQMRPLVYLNNIFGSVLDGDSEAYSFEISFEYQYAINNHINISVVPYFAMGNIKNTQTYFYWGGWDVGGILESIEYYYKNISYRIDPGIIIRPFGNRLRGAYIKLYSIIGFSHIIISEYDIRDTIFTFGFAGESGYQWILNNGFTLVLGGGIGGRWLTPVGINKAEYIQNQFLVIDLNFGLGYSF